MHNNYENFPEGDFNSEEFDELKWNEFDWQAYVRNSTSDIAKFVSLYVKHKNKPSCLEDIFKDMNWAVSIQDLYYLDSVDDEEADDDVIEFDNSIYSSSTEEMIPAVGEPVTIHKQPLYVVTYGLYHYMHTCWSTFLETNPQHVNLNLFWTLAQTFMMGQHHALLSIQFMNDMDYSLCVCHAKFVVSSLNLTLKVISQLPLASSCFLISMQSELKRALFLLREIWLQVMNDNRLNT